MKRAAPGLLLAANLLFFWPVLFHGRVFSSHDVVLACHPWRAVSGIEAPRNPLLSDPATASETTLKNLKGFPRGFCWNSSIASGAPGPLNLVQGNLSPFFWLPALVLPEAWIETGILFLKFNASFLFAWLFLRSRKFSETAAAAGAAAWAWTSAQSVWWLWMHTSVSIFFPLLLWAVDRALEEKRTARAVALCSAVVLGALSGGFPHWLIFGAFAGSLYFFFQAPPAGPRRAAVGAVRLLAAAGLSAAVLLPAILFSARFLRESGQLEIRRGLGTLYPMPPRQLRLMLAPEYAGGTLGEDYRGVGFAPMDNYVETAAGLGSFALGAAALAVTNRKRRRLTAYAAALAALVALPLYGGGPLLHLAGALPGMSTGLFARAKTLIVFALCLAVAVGVESLEGLFDADAAAGKLVKAIPFGIAVPLVALAARFYPAVAPSQAVFRDTPGIAALRRLEASSPARFAATGWTLPPNVAEALGLEDIRSHLIHGTGYRDLLYAVDRNVYGRHGTFLILDPKSFDPCSPVLDLLNVTAIAAPPGVDRPDSAAAAAKDPGPLGVPVGPQDAGPRASGNCSLPKTYSGKDLTIFARPTALPRFFTVSQVVAGGVPEVQIAPSASLRSEAFVSSADRDALQPKLAGRRPAAARVTLARYGAEAFTVEVEAPSPVLLASSQKLFDPYWRARLDGRETPVVACDGLFFGVFVPAGRHRVEGVFRVPAAEKAVSLAAALLLGTLGLASRRRPAREAIAPDRR